MLDKPTRETDYYRWLLTQADRIECGEKPSHELVEELRSLARSEKNAALYCIQRILETLMKLDYCDEESEYFQKNHAQWSITIRKYRRSIHKLLNDNPTLKKVLPHVDIDELVRDQLTIFNTDSEHFRITAVREYTLAELLDPLT